jgi:hypothetical protein
MNDDDRLHEAFQAARVSELADTPPFRRVLAGRVRSRRQRLVPKLLTLGAVIVVLIIAVGSLGRPDPDPDVELARQVMAWPGITDFLLPASAPGLLSTVPRIAEAVPGSPFQALDPGGVLGPPLLPRSPL